MINLTHSLQAVFDDFEDGQLSDAYDLAEKIMAGKDDRSADEIEDVYGLFPILIHEIQSLMGLCKEREEWLALAASENTTNRAKT